MMHYRMDQMYEAERAKTAAEIRRADDEIGRLMKSLLSQWHAAGTDISMMLAVLGGKAVADAMREWAAKRALRRSKSLAELQARPARHRRWQLRVRARPRSSDE